MKKLNRLIRPLTLVVIMLMLTATHASAALARCRMDPIFVLSNGDVVAATIDVSADPSRINNVTYILHVPAGVTVKQVIHTALGFGVREIYKVYQDSSPRTYITDTVVSLQSTTGSVAVTAYVRLNGVSSKVVPGYSGQHLILTVSRP
jgi:hypothetical protein